MLERKVFESLGPIVLGSEDSGMSLVLSKDSEIVEVGADDLTTGVFVELKSWDANREHKEMHSLVGKRVRLILEVIED